MYESGIHPMIKFIHDTKIQPTGWVSCKLSKSKHEIKTGLFTSCENEYTCSYKDISLNESDALSSYRIASFDIECDSAHGDFPMPKKDFKKLANDIFESYQNILKNSPESRRNKLNSKILSHLNKLLKS